MSTNRFCEQCGSAVSATARFCASCGFSLSGDAPAVAGAPRGKGVAGVLPWLVPTLALIAVVIYAAVMRSPRASTDSELTGSATGATMSATDISALSPDERVDRLFNRVMSLASAGKADSVAFFAPMAVNSFAALEPLSLHRRYDLGLVHLVSGEHDAARAQADSILAVSPTHLLGLALAMRTATAAGDAAGARRFGAKFKEALASERARGLAEYGDHASDIDDAVAEAEGRPGSGVFTKKP